LHIPHNNIEHGRIPSNNFLSKRAAGLTTGCGRKGTDFSGNYIDKLSKSCYLSEGCHDEMNGFLGFLTLFHFA
jgi:hypothetical protein